jgi:hypothetical protein
MPCQVDAPNKIREKMDLGILPREAPPKMYAGYGKGEPCAGCETPILPAQVEYQWDSADGRTLRFHLGCAGHWEAERRRRGLKRADP